MRGDPHEYVRSIVARAMEFDDPAQRKAFAVSACEKTPDALQVVLDLIAVAEMSTGTACTQTTGFRHDQGNLAGNHCFVPGQIVDDRFRILEFINQGGMGEVYAALDLNLQQKIALKTIRPTIAAQPGIIERFKTEVKQSLRITHPNVCRVHQLASHQDPDGREIWFLTMELLEGKTLGRSLAAGEPMAADRALVLIRQMVSGLACAHQAGIVHRDLKPGNLMLVSSASKGERLVITDFGLAISASPGETGGLSGTPAYMAPEQASGGAVGPPTDLFALGLIICEMLTGNRPRFGLSSAENCGRQLNDWLSSHPKIQPQIRPVIMRCLQFRPEDRFTDAREIVSRLEPRRRWSTAERAVAASVVFAASILTASLLPALGERIVNTFHYALGIHRPTAAAQAAADGARVELGNVTRAGFLEAIADFRRATQLDPKWAQAWAELAYTYAAAANAQVPLATANVEARSAALRAIRLDDRSAKAFGALGWVQSLDFDEWPKAEATLRRALALNSGDAQVHYWLGVHLRKKGKFPDAEAEDRQALTLSHKNDPSIWCELVFLHWTSGRLDQMEDLMKELLVAYPNFGLARFLNARLLKEQGKFDDALAELHFSESLQYPAVTVLAERASVEAYRGKAAEARVDLQRLQQASRTEPVDGLLIAGVYARLGEFDSAFESLDDAYARRDTTLLSAATSPLLKPLRGDPRFAALLRRLHFES
jgi:tetratricopeptide (TPR) repeat protein